jgi:predicted phosphodiesterase
MRTALVSDIHGNGVALRAMLDDLDRQEIDQVVCLGDVAQGGPEPVEVLDAVRDRAWRVVMGNADAFLLDPESGREPTTARHLDMREWSVGQLGPERLEFIAAFEPTIEASLGDDVGLLAFHGSPGDFDDVILPTLDPAAHLELLGEFDADVLAGGHVHVQWLRRFGGSVFLNPGSVGLGYDHDQPEDDLRFDAWASYAVLTVAGGAAEIAFRRVPFDYREVLAVLKERGMPYVDYYDWRWEPR